MYRAVWGYMGLDLRINVITLVLKVGIEEPRPTKSVKRC